MLLEANDSLNRGLPRFFLTDSPPNLCLIYFKITWTLAALLEHMHRKFEMNRTKVKGGCQSRRKVVPHDSKSGLLLSIFIHFQWNIKHMQWIVGWLQNYLGQKALQLEKKISCVSLWIIEILQNVQRPERAWFIHSQRTQISEKISLNSSFALGNSANWLFSSMTSTYQSSVSVSLLVEQRPSFCSSQVIILLNQLHIISIQWHKLHSGISTCLL